ncbi:hypothetical protein BSKO_09056 [Bryopsis sp. KO-2023]|nr:hypothetical protein BSKO_09056 [Bryopsis sp. KO-2023]
MKTTIQVAVLLLALLANFHEVRSTTLAKAAVARVVGGLFRGGARSGTRGDASAVSGETTAPGPPPPSAPPPLESAPVTVLDSSFVETTAPSIAFVPSVTTIVCPGDESLAGAIKAAILAEDISLVAALLSCSDDAAVLALGFVFSGDERALAFIRTEQREGDPDVVTMKAIATSSVNSEAFGKLAKMMRLAVGPYGGSTPEDQAKLEADLVELLSDADGMRAIIAADPATETL